MHALHEIDHLARQLSGGLRRPDFDNGQFLGERWIVDVLVQTAAAQRVGQFTRTVRGDDDQRLGNGAHGAELRNRHLEVRQQFEEVGFKRLVGAITSSINSTGGSVQLMASSNGRFNR